MVYDESKKVFKNQKKYLKSFLEDAMDNNSAEQAICPFCVGEKNWVMVGTIVGAEAR